MARKLQLRVVTLSDVAGNRQDLDYGLMIVMILRTAPRGGVVLDDMLKAVDALRPVEAAIEAKAGEVTLTDGQWRTLVEKLNQFPFAVNDLALVEFGLMIRDAPEIGTAPSGNGSAGDGLPLADAAGVGRALAAAGRPV